MITSNANYIACHNKKYCKSIDMLAPLSQNGIFVLNSNWSTIEELEMHLPAKMRKQLAQKNAKFYNLNASQIAQDVGLKKRINNIMQAVFYKLSKVLPEQQAIQLLKQDIKDTYSTKGDHIVEMNIKAVDETFRNLQEVKYDKAKWLQAEESAITKDYHATIHSGQSKSADTFFNEVFTPILNWDGDHIPVSKFTPGGFLEVTGTTSKELRTVAVNIPIWKPNECTQCNYCSLVCPHAAIRPFLLDSKTMEKNPKNYATKKAKGGNEMSGLNYTI